VLLLDGEPFGEELVMWWNFVARSHEEVVETRAAWESGSLFGRGSRVRRAAAPRPADADHPAGAPRPHPLTGPFQW
jgi:hypothetical protein